MAAILRRLTRHLPAFVMAAALLALAGAIVQARRWQAAHALNRDYAAGTLKTQPYRSDEAERAYAVGHLLALEHNFDGASRAFTTAEAADDPALRALARQALANLYFERGLRAADVAAGGSHLQGLAQIDLAREAYKGALRLDPQLRDARYNLELLDRLSPPRRVEGWERDTDGVTLAPQKRDGWASMKDNVRRGLP